MPHLLFWGVGFWWFPICVLGFVSSIDLVLEEYVSQVEGGSHLL